MSSFEPVWENGTISIAFVEAVLGGVRAAGYDADELLRQVGLSAQLLSHPQARVSAPGYTMLLRLIAQLLDDEFFGQDSRRMKVGSFAMLCHNAIHCERLDAALNRILRGFALQLDDLQGSLGRREGMAVLSLRETNPERPPGIFAQEALMMFVHRLACWLVNRRLPIRWMDFRYPPPPHHGEYRLMFCADLRFGQPCTALAFDGRHLALPVVRPPRALKDFLRTAPENLLVQYKDPHSVASRILRRLEQISPADWPGFDQLAEEMRSSPSTLRRRLDSEGQSYQAIKDQIRRDRAINLLSDAAMSVMEIAADLGFAETSAFHRAFKKWTGASPGEYRCTAEAGRAAG